MVEITFIHAIWKFKMEIPFGIVRKINEKITETYQQSRKVKRKKTEKSQGVHRWLNMFYLYICVWEGKGKHNSVALVCIFITETKVNIL